MVLPALVNLVVPARLTPDWTFPNWALLPVVLYGSRKIAVDSLAVAGAGLVALAVSVCFLLASPFMAYAHLKAGLDSNRPSSQEVAALAEKMTDKPPRLYWGSPGITGNLPFYLAGTTTARGRSAVRPRPFRSCRTGPYRRLPRRRYAVPARPKPRSAAPAPAPPTGTISRSFLGYSAKPIGFRVTVVPAQR